MIIKVDLFTDTGKWAYGGLVDIGDTELWEGKSNLKRVIVENQDFVTEGSTLDGYYIVTDNVNDDDDFCKCVIPPVSEAKLAPSPTVSGYLIGYGPIARDVSKFLDDWKAEAQVDGNGKVIEYSLVPRKKPNPITMKVICDEIEVIKEGTHKFLSRTRRVNICKRCDGKGSFEIETYAGPELYQCDKCNGTGEQKP